MYTIKQEKTNVEVEVKLTKAEWDEGVEKTYQANKNKYAVDGFRKGHAPRKAIEKEYGDSVFFDDTINDFYMQIMQEILYANPEFEPVVEPTYQLEKYSLTNGIEFKIFLKIVPDFKISQYTGLTVKVHNSMERLEAQIEHQIEHLIDDHAKYVDVERPVQNGDSALIDFMGFMDNVQFPGGTATDYPLDIGAHRFVGNFEEQLIGHSKGEVVDVNITFPEDYDEELGGKDATFKVTIKQVREKIAPVLDDKFISDATEFETLEEYKKDLREHTQEELQKYIDNEFSLAIIHNILKNTEIEIPDEMVEQQQKYLINQLTQISDIYKISPEEYLKMTGFAGSYDEYLDDYKKRTLESIKTRYIFRKIIKEKNLDLTEEELAKAHEGQTEEKEKVQMENKLQYDKIKRYLRDNNKYELIPDDAPDEEE